jgi:hypothetical protein
MQIKREVKAAYRKIPEFWGRMKAAYRIRTFHRFQEQIVPALQKKAAARKG